MKTTFTRQEVKRIVISMLLFSNANNNQGLNQVTGENFGEQAETIINSNENAKFPVDAIKGFKL